MAATTEVPPEGGESGRFSIQRSMDIFWAISNLSVEWNTKLLMSSFVKIDNQEEYWKDMHEKMAASIVANIKNLKGCWVKLGQMLSTKPGMLPKCYIDAFCQLQDGMSHSDFAEVIDTLEQEVGYMDDVFKNFDSIPLASASIAQVHKAKLFDGQVVAIKVQHKCSEQNLKNDLEILKMLTWVMQKINKYTKMCQSVQDYARAAMDELDFTHEAASCKQALMAAKKSGIPIYIPKIFDKYSSKRIITMQYFKLYKMTDVEFVKNNNIDAEAIVYDIHDFAMYQILSTGFFHGDPHPGNLQLCRNEVDGKYYPVLLDWGMTQALTTNQRMGFCRLTESLCMGDTIGCFTGFQQAGFNLMQQKVFSYERFLESLLNIFSSDFNKVMDVCSEDSTRVKPKDIIQNEKWHYQGKEFMKEFITNAPNFFPLLLKMITEYRNYAIILESNVPFLQILYKNTAHAIYNTFYSPLYHHISSLSDKAILLRKVKRIKHRLAADCIDTTERQVLGRMFDEATSSAESIVDLQSGVNFRRPINYLESKISSLLRHLSKDASLVVSVQVAVMRDGQVEADISHGTMGRFDCRPINSTVLFQLGNMMTALIATAVLNLATHEKLNLDDTIAKHWPEFGKNGKATITVRQMLNHSSGIVTPYPRILLIENIDYETMVLDIEKAHLFKEFSGQTTYAYLFYGWIMAELIKRVSGKCMEEYILEMAHTVNVPMKQLIFPSFSMNNEEDKEEPVNLSGYTSEECETPPNYAFGNKEKLSMIDIPLDDVKLTREFVSGDITPELQVTTLVSMESVKARSKKSMSNESPKPGAIHEETAVTAEPVKTVPGTRATGPLDIFRDLSIFGNRAPANKAAPPTALPASEAPAESHSMFINGRNIFFDKEPLSQQFGNLSMSTMSSCVNLQEDLPDESSAKHPSSKSYAPTKSSSMCVELSSQNVAEEQAVPTRSTEINELAMCMDDFLNLPSKSTVPLTVEELKEIKVTPELTKRAFTGRYLRDLQSSCSATEEESGHPRNCLCSSNKEEEQNIYRRCITPSEDCPTENRFVRHHREPLINLDHVDFTKTEAALAQEIIEGTNGIYDPVVVSEGEVVTDQEELSELDLSPEYRKVTRTRMKKFLIKNTVQKERVVHHNNFEVVSYGCLISDPISMEYPLTYKKSIPFMNGRASAMALTMFFNSVMEGKLINDAMFREAMHTVYVDRSPMTKVFTGLHTPAWGLGFQRFYLRRRSDGEVFIGMGAVDLSGSLTIMVPELKLVATLLFSNIQKVMVSHEVFRLVLSHYGFDLMHANLHVGDPTVLYRLLATIRI